MVKKRLKNARKKLQQEANPSLISFASYLRISCLVIKEINPIQSERLSYLNLLKLLSQQEPEWCNKCFVSSTGVLTSDEPSLKLLLRPITELHYLYLY